MNTTARNLCLHYVTDTGPSRRLVWSVDELRSFLRRENSLRTHISLQDYCTEVSPNEGMYSLSFDDAHRSVLTLALPVLRSLQLTATIFVPTGYVGTHERFLTWNELAQLRDAGWTIGAHSVTHPRVPWKLYGEDPPAHEERLHREFQQSREALEKHLGIEVSLLAYPYGEDPEAARNAARRAGFKAAFTVREDLQWKGDLLSIPRLDATEAQRSTSHAPTKFSVILPAKDRSHILTSVLDRLQAQSYPEDRFEVIVVNDGSTQDLATVLRGRPSHFRLLHSDGIPGKFRAGQARQLGADNAQFDHLAFLDADVAVQPDYLWALDWIHQRERDAAVLGYLSGYNLHDLGWIHSPEQVRSADEKLDLPIIPDRSREPTLRACLDNVDWIEAPWKLCYTGNLSVPKHLLERIGGFAREFEGWGLEDVDLGYRLHQAGAHWVFSRFALGYHIVDPEEISWRNPFRQERPTREMFAGYLQNLDTLAKRNRSPEMEEYRARTLEDIEETCGRPRTVGIEMGGVSARTSVFHHQLERVQPGGIPTEELLDRVAYAKKVGAKNAYLLGGEPPEHPGFLAVLSALYRASIRWIAVQTAGFAFADEAKVLAARKAGLAQAMLRVYGRSANSYDTIFDQPGGFEEVVRALENLKKHEIERTAQVILTESTVENAVEIVEWLTEQGVRVDEVLGISESVVWRAGALLPGMTVRKASP